MPSSSALGGGAEFGNPLVMNRHPVAFRDQVDGDEGDEGGGSQVRGDRPLAHPVRDAGEDQDARSIACASEQEHHQSHDP